MVQGTRYQIGARVRFKLRPDGGIYTGEIRNICYDGASVGDMPAYHYHIDTIIGKIRIEDGIIFEHHIIEVVHKEPVPELFQQAFLSGELEL